MKALRCLRYLPDWRLLVCGFDSRWRYYQKQAQKLGLMERVVFHGFVSDPRDVFSKTSVLVSPTRYDPASNVLLEAMASGVIPIGSSCDGMTEIIPQNWMVLSPQASAKEYAQAIKKAYEASGLSEQCREIAMSFPSKKSFAELFDLGFQ